MRQAGRYHKHYQALRQKHSFMDLCKIPELAAEVAFGPVDEFDFDLAILFSDLLFPLEALGMGLEYTEGGPRLGWYLEDVKSIKKLKSVDDSIGFMDFQKKALSFTREKIPKQKSVIGFVGGSWTLFAYATNGSHDGNLTVSKRNVALRKKFFPIITDFLKRNIALQLESGAEVVMIFDTAAGELSLPDFKEIIVPYVNEFATSFPGKIGYYGKSTTESHIKLVEKIKPLAGIGFDHRLNLANSLKKSKKGFIQGNFDQSMLFLEKNDFIKYLKKYIKPIKKLSLSDRAGWVSGLGHGVLPKTPEDNVKRFIEVIREEFA